MLACTNCNSTKGKTEIILAAYIWPHVDNSARAYIYTSAGRISIHPTLSVVNKYRALNTIKLMGLDREPSDDPIKNGDLTDQRWRERRTVWGIAERALHNLRKFDVEEMRSQIVDPALGYGYFSIWMSIFANDKDMLRRFIHAFQGTAKGCYNKEYQLIKRDTGRL